MNSLENLEIVYKAVESKKYKYKNYCIPSAWLANSTNEPGILKINPFDYFLMQFDKIFNSQISNKANIRQLKPIVYNLFPRYTTAFDHNNDTKISLDAIDNMFFETGTILKSIALLPYLYSLGVDIIYLLPIFEVGIDGRKGNLGSPYAIKNHFKLDPRLSEPFLDVTLETQFKAFVESCHRLGIKVVLEFVLRTVSLDCDLAIEHPDWFYWVYDAKCNEIFIPPEFTADELIMIEKQVQKGDYEDLIQPNENYRNLFSDPPVKVYTIGNKIFGEDNKGNLLRIPNAFADWPPNDNQPIWSDVTYLKYYVHPEFNYIAYNTVRMYEKKLRSSDNTNLWSYLIDIIPYYVKNFDIDGAMIDMGHAMPSELFDEVVNKAKKSKRGFLLWEENFKVTEESKKKGYSAVLGYLPFDHHEPEKFRKIISKMERNEFPLPFFLSGESHNTPRSARFGCRFNQLIWAFDSFLNGLRFILTGFELCEVRPINTGLCFKEEEIKKLPPERLPLFSALSMDWISFSIVDTLQKINKLHDEIFQAYQPTIRNWENLPSIRLLEIEDVEIVAYQVFINNGDSILVVGNFSRDNKIFSIEKYFGDNINIKEIYPFFKPVEWGNGIFMSKFECRIFLISLV